MQDAGVSEVAALRRAFLAVVPPPPVLDAIEDGIAPLRAGASTLRWIRREQWHITLQFFGPASEPSLIVALRAELGSVAPFELRLGGGGAFPKPHRASVLRVGVDHGVDALTSLSNVVQAATAPLGFAVGDRDFHPHVTVARLSRPGPVAGLVDALGERSVGPSWMVDHAILFESDTRPDGAVSTKVARFSLGG